MALVRSCLDNRVVPQCFCGVIYVVLYNANPRESAEREGLAEARPNSWTVPIELVVTDLCQDTCTSRPFASLGGDMSCHSEHSEECAVCFSLARLLPNHLLQSTNRTNWYQLGMAFSINRKKTGRWGGTEPFKPFYLE